MSIFTIVFLLFLFLGIIIVMIYLDYNFYLNNNDANFNIYLKGKDIGIKIPFSNKSLDFKNIKMINEIKDLKNFEPKENEIYFFIEEEFFFDNLISDKIKIYNTTLTKEEIKEIYSSDNVEETLRKKLRGEDLDKFIELSQKKGMSPLNYLFFKNFETLKDDKLLLIKLYDGYKSNNITIKPERFSLKLAKKYLPYDFVKEKIESLDIYKDEKLGIEE